MTREEAISEITELERDLLAFKKSRDCLHERLRELEDFPDRRSLIEDWPAFRVIDNGLILAIVRCEGLIEDYRRILDDMDVPDNVIELGRKDSTNGH